MSGAIRERVTLDQLIWVSACLGLTLLSNVDDVPVWVTATAAVLTVLRVGLAARGRDAPPKSLRLVLTVAALGLLFFQYRTFNGLVPGTALLTLIAGLKLMETQTRRDIYVIVMIIYFLCLATLLEGESFWLLCYLIAVSWLTTSTLLRLADSPRRGDWRRQLPYAARLLAQAVPLALALWLFFPRFGGPLWQMPVDTSGGTSGLSDTMSPGDITELAQSDEVAFRAHFDGATPPPTERYWRGPVLHEFDGHAWRRDTAGLPPGHPPRHEFEGPAYHYTVNLEPSRRNWLFVLDWPAKWDSTNAYLTHDGMLLQPTPLSQPVDLIVTSFTHIHAEEPLSAALRNRETQLPPGRNPRTLRLAEELRAQHPGDVEYVDAVLDLFRRQAFYYTLTPPRLAADSVDAFLFDTKRGFCGHYASAFATLVRAVGIPARIVTGYQGGTYNRFAGYWILRQSDAHAWDEVWLDGRGWIRVDPTAVVPPSRVERGLNDLATADAPLASRWQQRTPWLSDLRLRIDALRVLWRERILQFDSGSQDRLLAWLHIPEPDGQKLALLLAASLIAVMSWLTWQVRRELHQVPQDALMRAYARLCRRMRRIGIERLPHEGAEGFAARVARQRPDLGAAVMELCRWYSRLRYGAAEADAARARAAVNGFSRAVRHFKPRGSRGSS